MTSRVILLAAGAAAVLLVLVTVVVTVAVTSGDGSAGEGAAGEGAGGEGQAGRNPEPAGPPNMTGEWGFVVTFEPGRNAEALAEGETDVRFILDLYEEDGYLSGEGEGWLGKNAEETRFDMAVRTGEGSYVRDDGTLSLIVSGDSEDNYDDYLSFELTGEPVGSGGRIEGEAEGSVVLEIDETTDTVYGETEAFAADPAD